MATYNSILNISEAQSIAGEVAPIEDLLNALHKRLRLYYSPTHKVPQATSTASMKMRILGRLLNDEVELLQRVVEANREELQHEKA